jgi:uncharacterized protein with FMN-binding domain
VKRALAALVGTVAGFAALLGYKSGPAKRVQLAPPQAAPNAPAPPSTSASTARSTAAPRQGWEDDSSGEGDGTVATTVPAAPSTTTFATTPSTAAPASGPMRTVTGPDLPNDYGDVQVQLTLDGTRIIDVKALQLPHDRPRSYEISLAAAPLLREEVLHAQSANIDLVSGATYTSQSYAQSVQAALDQARA